MEAASDAALLREVKLDLASALLARHRVRLRTGCDAIDECLGGGFPVRGITEIAGESSAGKTQLALQLLFQAQLPLAHGGLQGGALFLHTEGGDAPVERLRQIGAAFAERWTSLGATCDRLCEHIFIERVDTADMLMSTLRYRVPGLLAANRVRLIVIDSIAALFRTYMDDNLPQRSALLMSLAAEMKRISEQMHVAFIVVNQVTGGGFHPPTAQAKRAALGLTWSHCVNTRVLLSRDTPHKSIMTPDLPAGVSGGSAQHTPSRAGRRTLRVLLSPCVEPGSCAYTIDSGGVRDVDDGQYQAK
ncbi:P-loop containing nucleoside triphosphate hydrolase protein [Pavlovales sp. CCMP2436]|nr:P-loop containing nucleoside triphosphate hydrolase protein [Pavlovales sp. CCMP2436]